MNMKALLALSVVCVAWSGLAADRTVELGKKFV